MKVLVSGVIIRQENEFSDKYIFELVKENLSNCSIIFKDSDICDLIDKMLDILVRTGEVRCIAGVYYPKSID